MARQPDPERFARQLAARLDNKRVRRLLIGSAIVTMALYLVPFGRFLVYPLLLISTLVHELGHGLAALSVGGNFDKFVMFANGSGVASASGVLPGWRDAVVSAGGLVGPACLAGVLFVFVRGETRARVMVAMLALSLLVAEALVVRNAFGLVFVGALAVGLAYVAARRPAADAQLVLAFVAVQLAVSVFSRGDYLFTESAETSLGTLPSDVAQMASALGGAPYWVWGIACGAFSVVVLALGLWWALRSPRAKS